MSKTVLIVDDELDIQSSLSFALKDEGFEVFTATLPAQAEEIMARERIDLGLFDVWFPEGDGMELLNKTRKNYPHTTVVMMSGHGNIELALNAIRSGAYDFLEKPLELEKVLVVLRNASETQTLKDENRRLSYESWGGIDFIGNSLPVQNIKALIEKSARAQSHVLIQGENGTGKELVARLLHYKGMNSDGPFVAVNCAAIPENLVESTLFGHEKGAFTGAVQRSVGRFEQAGAGTLFLDEISELSLSAQGKLLRILEEKKFERVGSSKSIKTLCRVLVATNKDLAVEVKEGRFREDLYFRLKVLVINVPPLRDRRGDIKDLCDYFINRLAHENRRSVPRLSKNLTDWLNSYDWPGNVRELRNLLERMLILSEIDQGELGVADLPEELQTLNQTFSNVGTLREMKYAFEKKILEQRLKEHDHNVTKAAESLGLERAHLHRKLKQYGISTGA